MKTSREIKRAIKVAFPTLTVSVNTTLKFDKVSKEPLFKIRTRKTFNSVYEERLLTIQGVKNTFNL